MKLWSRWSRWLFKKDLQEGHAVSATSAKPTVAPARYPHLALRLERRLMFDAAGVVTALAALLQSQSSDGGDHQNADGGDHHDPVVPATHDTALSSPREVVVVDPSVPNYQTLLAGVSEDAQVVILDPHKDGVEQIRAALAGHSGIASLHIVSHGSAGHLALADSDLDVVSMEAHTQALQDWGAALAENADILIYGCDVGAGMTGAAFVSRLADLTGADVAASNDLTGAATRGGDWVLEVQQGAIEADTLLSAQAQAAYNDVLPSTNPIISNLHGDGLPYAEGGGTVVIDQGGDATVTDPDNGDFDGGNLTVAIVANRDPTQDLLGVYHQGDGVGEIGVAGAVISYQGVVIGTWGGGSGTDNLVVSFNANATPTAVSALLHTITYTNTDNHNPTASTRSISFTMNDGSGGTSSAAIASVAVTGVNDAPVLTAGNAITTTENDAPSVVDPTITVTDVDNANLQSAVVQISANYQSGADQLLFTNTGNITGSWNAATGTLTLTGSDTKANYQAALRSVQYQNISDAPSALSRTVSFQVNDGTASSIVDTATVDVIPVNDAPILTAGGTWYLPSVERGDTMNPAGTVVGSLFSAADITDPDPTPLQGIAIYDRSNVGVGNWQCRIDGGAWVDLPVGINSSNTFLLKSTDEIRFKPDNSDSGQPTLSFYAWDQTVSTVGDSPNANTRGTTTEFSLVSGTIRGTVNAAPVLDNASPTHMATITEDATTNGGQTVSSIVGALITDSDAAPVEGIAIQSLVAANGTWQYSINAGANWTNVGVVSSAQSLLLRPTDLVRYVPDGLNPPGNTSPGAASFTFVAWDQSGQSETYASGSKVSTVTSGAATPFSIAIETADITVTDLNDAPVLTPISPVLSSIRYLDTGNPGITISSLVGASIGDVDLVTAPWQGIAVNAVNNGVGGGYWEFSTDNGATWTATGAVSNLQALLLRSEDQIRFQPGSLNTSDTASFSYYAWDQTQGLGGQGTKVDASLRGGTTTFSTASDTASIRVNVAPTLDSAATPAFPTITEDQTTNAGVIVSSLLGGASDLDVGAARGLALYGLASGNGTWQYNTGSGWNNVGAVSATSALLLRDTDQLRFVPNAIKATTGTVSFYAWDRTAGTFGTKVNVSSRGGTTAFSTVADTATIIATEINDAPTLASGGTRVFTEGSAATVIHSTLTLGDVDDLNIAGATVRISGHYVSGEDVLAFTNQSGITGSWNAATGTMTLTGSATKVQYRTALRSVTYENINTDKPDIGNRTVTWTITDGNSDGTGGGALTASATRTIAITAVNDAPAIVVTGTALAVTEGDAATSVDPGLTLTDVDDTHVTGATVQITANYLSSEDLLSFTDQLGISGSWNAGTGTLTLTGTATKADYQTALRSLTYQNTNGDDPNITARTITFTVTDANSGGEGAGALTTTVTRTMTVTAVNDAPVAMATAAALSYTEGDGAIVLDSGFSLADLDDNTMVGATIQISGNYLASEDVLAFIDQSGISGSWDAVTGTLTLTGTASKADYQTALRSITYQNTNGDNPSVAQRTVTFSVTDGNSNGQGGGALTTTVTRDIVVQAVNDPLGVTTTGIPLAYTEGGIVAVDTGLTLADVDDATLVGATVQITDNYFASEDVLAFIDQSGISGSWNAVTGTLTLSGTASKADYQTALRSITYQNTNDENPSIADRTVVFSVTDGNSNGEGLGMLTATATRDIIVQAVNDAPGVILTGSPLSYTESAIIAVDADLVLEDGDDTTVVGATVQITGHYLASEDVLAFDDQAGISGSWDAVTGTLTLSGTASQGDYQTALRSITYQNINDDNPHVANRTVAFSITDDNSNGEGSGALTTTVMREIVVHAVNDPLGITTTGMPLSYTESDAAILVDADLTLADVDDAGMSGATVQISGNYFASEDVLAFIDQSGISGSWDVDTGILTLSGTASTADYQTALRSITYHNTNHGNPSVANRTILFSVTDGNTDGAGAGARTTAATRDMVMYAINDAPEMTTTGVSLSYMEGGTVAVDAGLSLVDVDDTTVVGAVVQITGNYVASEDVLAFIDQSGISGSWDAVTGTLTLSGTASKADYQAALRSVTYHNTNEDIPSIVNRTVVFSIMDGNSNGEGGGALTTTATRAIVVHAVNDAPVVTITGVPLSYTESDAAIMVDAELSLADVDDATLVGATVQIIGNHVAGEDVLTFSDQWGISGSWDATTGTLTLSGTASKADYQAALRSITYHNTNDDNPSVANRTIAFSIMDGNAGGEGAGGRITTVTRDIAVHGVHDAPVWSGEIQPIPTGWEEHELSFSLAPQPLFTDGDSPHLVYWVEQGPYWLHFNPETQAFRGTPQRGDAGVYEIILSGMDETGAKATATFQMIVEASAPVVVTQADPEISLSHPTELYREDVEMIPVPLPMAPSAATQVPSAVETETVHVPPSVVETETVHVPPSVVETRTVHVPPSVVETRTVPVNLPMGTVADVSGPVQTLPTAPLARPIPPRIMPESVPIFAPSVDTTATFSFSKVQQSGQSLDRHQQVVSRDLREVMAADLAHGLKVAMTTGRDATTHQDRVEVLPQNKNASGISSSNAGHDDSQGTIKNYGSESKPMEIKIGSTLRDDTTQFHVSPVKGHDEKRGPGTPGYGRTEAEGEGIGMPGLTDQLNAFGHKAFHTDVLDFLRTVQKT
ncbi:MAG: DUF4347 domain-containing protein [Magnetococcus sp. THC-1_WYH]